MDQGEKAFYLLRPELSEEELRLLLCLVALERLLLPDWLDLTAEPDCFEELLEGVDLTADRFGEALLRVVG
jgi:hypothetical protein